MGKCLIMSILIIFALMAFSFTVYAGCQLPPVNNCNAECSHLPSYPTYEKEDCIMVCLAESNRQWNDYYACLDNMSEVDVDIEPIVEHYDSEPSVDEWEDSLEFTEEKKSGKPSSVDELPDEIEAEIFAAYSLYSLAASRGDEHSMEMNEVQLYKSSKKAAEYLREDPSEYDVFAQLKQLKKGQTSMSEEEKHQRMVAAELAYHDLLIDESNYEAGDSSLKQTIEDKRCQLLSQYGRVLLFDQDNVKANLAMGDLLRKEGRFQDSEVFYRRALKTAEPGQLSQIRDKLGSEFHSSIAAKMGIAAPEQSSFVKRLGDDFVDSMKKAKLDVSNQAQEIEIWVRSGMISKDMDEVFENIKEVIFSFSTRKAEEARDG